MEVAGLCLRVSVVPIFSHGLDAFFDPGIVFFDTFRQSRQRNLELADLKKYDLFSCTGRCLVISLSRCMQDLGDKRKITWY